MHRSAAPAHSARYGPAPRRPPRSPAPWWLCLLVLALWWTPVAAGSALSPAAGSTGAIAEVRLEAAPDASPQRPPQELERGSDLFGKRRIERGNAWVPPLPPLSQPHTPADASPTRHASSEHARIWTHGDDALPPRDHRRLLTERYPPQAPPHA